MGGDEGCGCAHHGAHHAEQRKEEQEEHGRDCGCGGHGHHERQTGSAPHPGCTCACHQPQGGAGFRRRFISRQEVIDNLAEYLKQLQAEAKGVEERIAEMKKEGSQ
jgi:hypothetical protein